MSAAYSGNCGDLMTRPKPVSVVNQITSTNHPAFPTTVGEAVEDHIAQVVGITVRSDTPGDGSHLLDEVDESQIEVILDEGEARKVDPFVRAALHFRKRDVRGFLRGGINQHH